MSRLTIIVAATKSNGIGRNGNLPWRLSKELKYFAQVTTHAPEETKNAVIMGRNTWESIPTKFRPLPNRVNVVVSRNKDYELGPVKEGAIAPRLANGLASSINNLTSDEHINRVFIIGGGSLYRESLSLTPSATTPFVDRILLTRIMEPDFECDVFMPGFGDDGGIQWVQASHAELQDWVGVTVPEGIQEENGVKYEFQMWTRSS